MVKITDETLRSLRSLGDSERDAVDKVVKAHIRACTKAGSPVENLDRVTIEAVEMVRLEGVEEVLKSLKPARSKLTEEERQVRDYSWTYSNPLATR